MLQHRDVVESAEIRVLSPETRKHLLGYAVHATDCRHDEQIVADADPAAFAAVAVKGQMARRIGEGMQLGRIFILLLACQRRLEVVGMHPIADGDGFGGVAYRVAVLDHPPALQNGSQSDLMPLRDIAERGHARSVDLERLALRERAQGDGDIVARAHLHQASHGDHSPRQVVARRRRHRLLPVA
ncbi:hypothetical protein D3C81_1405150 [compost metagenome]